MSDRNRARSASPGVLLSGGMNRRILTPAAAHWRTTSLSRFPVAFSINRRIGLLNSKSKIRKLHRLARAVARKTGGSLTKVMVDSLRERYEKLVEAEAQDQFGGTDGHRQAGFPCGRNVPTQNMANCCVTNMGCMWRVTATSCQRIPLPIHVEPRLDLGPMPDQARWTGKDPATDYARPATGNSCTE